MSGSTPIFTRLTGGNDRFANPATGLQVVYGLAGNDTISTSITRRDGTQDVLFGGAGADRVDGGISADRIYGGAGDDTLDGGDGGDYLDGDGDDINSADALFGADQIVQAAAGADLLDGGLGADTIFGGAGDDTLRGSFGADSLSGDDGNDNLDAGGDSQADTLDGGAGADTLKGSFGDNLMRGGDGDDSASGGAGADTIDGGAGNDFQDGGDGNDVLIGGAGADTLDGGGGFDTASYAGSDAGVTVQLGTTVVGTGGHAAGDSLLGIEALTGSAWNDVLLGDGDANRLSGLAGNDILVSGGGADTLDGGDGIDLVDYRGALAAVAVDLGTGLVTGGDTDMLSNIENVFGTLTFGDTLTGSAAANQLIGFGGDDLLAGGDGNDTLSGDVGADTISGGGGADTLIGGADADSMAGEGGNDVYVVDHAGDIVTEAAGGGTDQVQSSVTFSMGDNLETLLLAGTAAINGTGNALANVIQGNAAANLLDGGVGNDTLVGAGGADTINGGAGIDLLLGGTGNDLFVYTAATDSTAVSPDQIGQTGDVFTSGQDKVDVSAIDANPTLAGDQAFTWVTALAAGTYGATIASISGTPSLIFDTNASGGLSATDMVIRLTGLTSFNPTTDLVL